MCATSISVMCSIIKWTIAQNSIRVVNILEHSFFMGGLWIKCQYYLLCYLERIKRMLPGLIAENYLWEGPKKRFNLSTHSPLIHFPHQRVDAPSNSSSVLCLSKSLTFEIVILLKQAIYLKICLELVPVIFMMIDSMKVLTVCCL